MQIQIFLLFVILFSLFSSFVTIDVFGHGLGSEILPPQELDGKFVTLEVSSSQKDENLELNDQQISVSLIDFDSKVTLRDVTFLIKAERGNQFLFEKEFQSKNGFIVFNYISENTKEIQIEEETGGDLFESLLGLQKRLVTVRGPELSSGGLYKFDVKILTAHDYSNKLDTPLSFNSGISIPLTISYDVEDPNFGIQRIDFITYYDEIENFQYDSLSREIIFSMPFEWSSTNINQTSVVHEELVIPKTFGDLLVNGFSVYVNDYRLSDDIITIDDFFTDNRIVHLIINQKELWNILNQGNDQNVMNFVIKPSSDDVPFSSVTDNGQFRILAFWEPNEIKSGSYATIFFDVTDVFLKNKPVSVSYDFSITQNEKTIFSQNGISTDSREQHNSAEFTIPSNINGIVNLNFENLDGNNLARTSIPIVIDRINSGSPIIKIPDWIQNNAAWWVDGQIDDTTFVSGIQFLIKEGIMTVPSTEQGATTSDSEIPRWIKNNAAWWVDGQIDDTTFVSGIQFLIKEGIMIIKP